jgi:hypothetical protein
LAYRKHKILENCRFLTKKPPQKTLLSKKTTTKIPLSKKTKKNLLTKEPKHSHAKNSHLDHFVSPQNPAPGCTFFRIDLSKAQLAIQTTLPIGSG